MNVPPFRQSSTRISSCAVCLVLAMMVLLLRQPLGATNSTRKQRDLLSVTVSVADPKTVDQKTQQQHSLQKEKYQDLQFLFFGTPSSLEGLSAKTYPFQVSETAINITTQDAIYPSRCVASLLKESLADNIADSVDVVVLEFADDFRATVKLIERLQQRYPDALLLVLDIWNPRHYHHLPSGGMSILEWSTQQQQHASPRRQQQQSIMMIREMTHFGEWEYQPKYSQVELEHLQTMNNVVVVQSPRPKTIHEALSSNSFQHRGDHAYSEAGHRFVSHMIFQTLENLSFRTERSRTVQPWMVVDFCEDWQRKSIAQTTTIRHDSKLEFSNYQKATFALEVRSFKSTSWIQVSNTHERVPMELLFEYLGCNQKYDYKRVQMTMVLLNNDNEQSASKTLSRVEAGCDASSAHYNTHLREQIHVGTIPPLKEVKIQIDTLPGSGKIPFRFVGIMLVPIDTL